MLDLTNIKTRYFTVKLLDDDENELTLHLKGCKLKTMNKLIKAVKHFDGSGNSENLEDLESLEELESAVALMLSNNKEGRRFSIDDIQGLTIDQMITLISEYFTWIGNEKKSNILKHRTTADKRTMTA